MLRLIGICALLYMAYWAGTNGHGIADLMQYLNSVVDSTAG